MQYYFRVKDCAPVATFEGGVRKIYNFLPGDNGNDNNILYVDYWDGTGWRAADQGLSSLANIQSFRPGVIAFQEGSVEKLYVFVCRDDSHVWVNWWDGSQWNWTDQGTPGQTLSDLAPITFLQGGTRLIHVFGVGSNGHLYVNWWDGSQWNWADQGNMGVQLIGRPTVVTYSEGSTQKIYAFVAGADGHLYVNYWNGSQWQWDRRDPGWERRNPAGSQHAIGAITYDEDGIQKIYVFGLSRNQDSNTCELYVSWWDGSQWQAANQGAFGPHGFPRSLSAITFIEGGVRKIHVFAVGADGHLWVNWWDGLQWNWADQGTPGVAVSAPAAITYSDGGSQKIYVFVTGDDRLPYVNWWNGSEWDWHRFRIRT